MWAEGEGRLQLVFYCRARAETGGLDLEGRREWRSSSGGLPICMACWTGVLPGTPVSVEGWKMGELGKGSFVSQQVFCSRAGDLSWNTDAGRAKDPFFLKILFYIYQCFCLYACICTT